MKGLIFYFSGTGTTKLATNYITSKIKNIEFNFHDMYDKNIPNLDQYSIIGFSTYAQLFSPPKYVEEFIINMKIKEKKYAFVFNTYGLINGNTLSILGELVKKKGYKLISGFSLHTPESSPIMIENKITSENAPNEKEIKKFNEFIEALDSKIDAINREIEVKEIILKKNKFFILLKSLLERAKLVSIGEKYVYHEKCIQCGLCKKVCPYSSICYDEGYPKFNEESCQSCFICYNRCPKQAIYLKKGIKVHYANPNKKITKKLEI